MVFLFLPFFQQVFDLIIDAGSWAFGGVGGGCHGDHLMLSEIAVLFC